MDIEKSLVSLAILKVNWDAKGADYIENFVPFVAESLRLAEGDVVSLAVLQESIKNEFGLCIPHGALKTILTRASRKGYATQKNGVYYRNLNEIPTDFAVERNNASRIQKSVTDKFISYCNEHHKLELSELVAEQAFFEFLQKGQVPILQTAVMGLPLQIKSQNYQQLEVLVALFLVHLHERDPDGFKCVEIVVKGQMISSLLFLPDIGQAQQKFNDLTVYFDTRIILRALGLEGEEYKLPATELMKLLLDMGVNLACFSQTEDELRGILDSVSFALKGNKQSFKYFSVMQYAVSQGWRSSDIENIIANLEGSLNRLRIFVKQRPVYATPLGINENKLSEIIEKNVNLQNADARRHDIDCLTSIHRLRGGHPRYSIESCNYIFVTSNIGLARAASEFFIDEYEKNTIPLCINDHTLATLAWVKNPKYAGNLSTQMLISACHASMQPDPELWKKYLAEIERMREHENITADQFHLLRFSITARNALLDSTLGSPDAFTEGTVPEILARAQQNITNEVQDKLDKEITSRRKAEDNANKHISDSKALAESQLNHINFLAQKLGLFAYWVIFVVLILLAVMGLVLTLPTFLIGFDVNDLHSLNNWKKILLQLFIVFFAILTLYSLSTGGALKHLANRMRVFVVRKAITILISIAVPNNHPLRRK